MESTTGKIYESNLKALNVGKTGKVMRFLGQEETKDIGIYASKISSCTI